MMSEEPNAVAAFMANLSSSSSQVNEVHSDDNHIFDNVDQIIHYTMMSEEPNAAAAFMANLSSSSSQVNEVHSDDNHIFDNVNHQLAQEMHQEEHLGFDDEYDFLTNTIPYKKLSLVSDAKNFSTEASAATSDQIAMIAILNNLTSQVVRHAKTNQEITLENETLKNELVRWKQEIGRLDTQKIKLDLENQVRQEQGLVIQRNQRNAKLLKENELLKSTLSAKDKSIEFLKSEKEKVFTDKKELVDSYLDDIVSLRSYLAKRTQPVLYDGNTLLDPTHTPVSVWDSDDVLVHQVVSMHKMKDKPGHVRLESGFYVKLKAIKFVPQTELLREQAYWLNSQDHTPSKPVTPFVRKGPPPSQVLASLHLVKVVFPQFESIIIERITKKPLYVSVAYFDYAKEFSEQ
nr:hypothetical protein [Tanacetum cinerariifolium]